MELKYSKAPWKWWDESTGRPENHNLCKLLDGDGGSVLYNNYGGSGELSLGRTAKNISNAIILEKAPELFEILSQIVDDPPIEYDETSRRRCSCCTAVAKKPGRFGHINHAADCPLCAATKLINSIKKSAGED